LDIGPYARYVQKFFYQHDSNSRENRIVDQEQLVLAAGDLWRSP
jgi:hypothetical protein